MSERVSVMDAAKEIGCAPGFLRLKIRTGEWDVGACSKPPRGGKNYRYYVFRSKLDRFLGKGGGLGEKGADIEGMPRKA